MGLVPVQFSPVHFVVGKPDLGNALELAPALAPKMKLQLLDFADRKINGNDFDVADFADQLKIVSHGKRTKQK
jgi:hypothetical protein